MRILGLGIVVVIGCGNVKHSAPDASVTVDAPPDGAPVRTAISADGIVAFNIAPSTFTKVPYTHVAYDDRGEFDASNARFTASHDGDYEVCASVFLHTLAKLEIDLFVDGSRERALAHGVGAVEGCRVERLAKGSTLEVWAYHDAATPLAVTNDAYWDWLTIHEQRASVSLVNINAFQAPPNTFTIVPYSTEVFDDHNEFDLNQSRFVAANAGDYEICASIALGNGNVGYLVQPSLYVNGNRERELFGSPDGDTGCHVVRLATGDVVDVRVYHTASTTLSISADPLWDWLTVQPVTARVAVGDTTSFAVPNATFTRVPYSSVLFNDEGEFDASIGRFTPKASGDYEICAALWDGRNSTKFELDIFVDGSREKAIGQPDVTPAGCRVVRLAAGAKLDIVAWQASGQTVTVPSNIFWNWLTVRPL